MSSNTTQQQRRNETPSNNSGSSPVPMHEKINTMIGKCLKYFTTLYEPLVKQLMRYMYGEQYVAKMRAMLMTPVDYTAQKTGGAPPQSDIDHLDAQNIINLLIRAWPDIQKVPNTPLSPSFRNYLFELKQVRNKWAHQYLFELRDAYRALDTFERVLSLPILMADTEVREVRKMYEYVLLHYANEIKRRQQREAQEQTTSRSSSTRSTSGDTASSQSSRVANVSAAPVTGLSAPQTQPLYPQSQSQFIHPQSTPYATPIYQQQQQQQANLYDSSSADDDALFSDYMDIEE